jgi:ArsR family transcriptional regulator
MDRYLETAEVFRLMAHPGRLQILDELRRDEACVCHLQAVLQRPQAYVSQQLRVLRDAGLVEDNRKGTMVYYRLIDPAVQSLLEESLGPTGEPTLLESCPCPCCQTEFAPQPKTAAAAAG